MSSDRKLLCRVDHAADRAEAYNEMKLFKCHYSEKGVAHFLENIDISSNQLFSVFEFMLPLVWIVVIHHLGSSIWPVEQPLRLADAVVIEWHFEFSAGQIDHQ